MNKIDKIKHDIKFYELDETFKKYLEKEDEEDLHVMQSTTIDKNIFKFVNVKEYYLLNNKIVKYIHHDILMHLMYFWDGERIITVSLTQALELPRLF